MAAGAAPATILVINVSRIGDTLLAIPAVRALASAFPGAEITGLAHPKRAEVLANLPFLSHLGTISKSTAPLRGWIPGKRYDLALVYGFDEALVAFATRVATRVVAFRQDNEELNRRLYLAVDRPQFQAEHSVFLSLKLVDALGIPHAGYRLEYHASKSERDWAMRELRRWNLDASAPIIGLQIASFPTKRYRDWPVESFAALAERIRQRWAEAHFLLYGGSEETARVEWLKGRLGRAATPLAGKLSLRETAALMRLTHLYVGVDTGPTHLMSCFDIPLIGLYHCFSPSRLIGPLQHPRFYAIEHPQPYPCRQETPMAEIKVDTVFEAVERALARTMTPA